MNEPLETDEQGNKRVNPEYCRRCGFKGTPLCTHPTGYYQPEPKGLNKLFSDLESNTILSNPEKMSEPGSRRNPRNTSEPRLVRNPDEGSEPSGQRNPEVQSEPMTMRNPLWRSDTLRAQK